MPLPPARLGITFLLLAAALVLMPVLAVRADDYVVTTNDAAGPGSLRWAILDANINSSHDTITFSTSVSGTIVLTAALPAISNNLTITGPGAENLAISGNDAYRVFEIDANTVVTIANVTVSNGNAGGGGSGGGIRSNGDLRLYDVHITDSSATSGLPNGLGGGVYVNGTAVLSGTHILDNSATIGGGIFISNGTATLTNTLIDGNYGAIAGGGVGVWGGALEVSGGEIRFNKTASTGQAYGGGIAVNSGVATLSGTLVYSNTSDIGGGGDAHGAAGRLNIRGGEIGYNVANAYGGGVASYNGTVTLDGVEVKRNSATSFGGGVYVFAGTAAMTETMVHYNSADNGGGMYVDWEPGTLNASGGEISGNAANNGGGVYVSQGTATLSGTRVLSNSVIYDGGGLYLASTGAIAATNGCVVNNSDTAADNVSGGSFVATGNWWGASNGPGGVGTGGGDSVSENVDFAPFATTPSPGCPLPPPADLYIVKTVAPGSAVPGQPITYTLAFANVGGTTASGIIISDSVPVSVTGVISTYSGVSLAARAGTHYAWDVGAMSAGESGIITLTGVLSDPLAAGVFINTAIISSATPDADPANNHDDASVAVNFAPVNVEPVAEAGDGQTVFVNATVTLDGSGSDDPDGHLPLTFGWRQTSGPDVTFTPDASITTFTAPTSTAVLNFTLIVTDALGLSSEPDSIIITVTEYKVFLPIISREGPATR